SEVRVARIDGEYVVNPGRAALENADLDIIVGATLQDVTMVEGEAKEVEEKVLVEAIRVAHEAIKVQINAQLELAKKVGDKAMVKREVTPLPENEELKAWVSEKAKDRIYAIAKSFADKQIRRTQLEDIKKELKETLTTE